MQSPARLSAPKRLVHRLDGLQQRHKVPAFAVAVVKKYGDDRASSLAVQLTYAMFVTTFPLLLLLLTILSVVLAGDPSARQHISQSAFGQFPIIGQQLAQNIHGLKRASPFGLVLGTLGLAYGATGLAQAGLYSMEEVWNIPGTDRPGFKIRLGRSVAFLCLLALGLTVTTGLSSFGTFGHHATPIEVLAGFAAALANIGLYLGAFRILTPCRLSWRSLLPGLIAWINIGSTPTGALEQ